ncbi:DUF642 domain-containing protein [Pseudomonas gingeri]|uniref:DUF642 domain-containing protein n=1 Tax=Pseudomonas gingeri TaxID=117681 RepID=UPI0015A18703|nr:DUF642 domain-containing protein [Pseudomonas gingeri]NWA05106.1 DUF642 domain-containing protein [Pseudomonas gingeri]NWA16389.1 DUF642 domain-containing protein [Pseudomonas gingeri]NWA54727.1 DUF642 domain-containing protein [Pseudomonas gingeri]NWA99116.1 DUF642 domain-containing protein [Pseudomonas gingeri]NWB05616.1 DUF642 domain-containing protein [Pseudomonas gingeri]
MKTIKRYLGAGLVSVVLLATGTPAFAANLLVNGSFESPGCAYNCILDTPAQADFISGWTTFLSGVEYFSVPATVPGSAAADGVNAVDLANYVYMNGGGIQQNFKTAVGQRYRLTFSAGNSAASGRTGTGVIQVKVAGQAVSFDTPVVTTQAVAWKTVTYDFTATTPQTTLSFFNEENPYTHFALIDNVIVEPL